MSDVDGGGERHCGLHLPPEVIPCADDNPEQQFDVLPSAGALPDVGPSGRPLGMGQGRRRHVVRVLICLFVSFSPVYVHVVVPFLTNFGPFGVRLEVDLG